MPDNSLRPMRPIQRVPFVEETLPVLNPEAARTRRKPAHPHHKPCAGFGLNTPANQREFARGFKHLQKTWPNLTPAQRRQQLEDLVNTQLHKGGVPRVGIVPRDLPTDDGQLIFKDWKLAINKNLLNGNHLPEAQAKELANTVYHESRHAEQWYLIAQQKAAQLGGAAGETPAQKVTAIQNAMGIPLDTAAQAQQHPLDAHDGRKACAQALNDSIYGAHAAHREQTLHDQDVKILADNHAQAHFDNVNRAYEKLRQNPHADPAAVQKAYQGAVTAGKHLEAANVARQRAYQAYQRLPEEADALETGDAVGKIL